MKSLRSPETARSAANVASVAFVIVILLQFLLAAGILPVTMAWGGTQTVLTTPLRLASLASVVVLTLFAYVIRRRAGLCGKAPPGKIVKILSIVITVYVFLNTIANFASSSRAETLVFGSLSLILAASCLFVSFSE